MNDRALAEKESYLENRLQPLTDLIIEAGADLTARDSRGCSTSTLIFGSTLGPEYLQSFVYRYIDLLAMDELTLLDSWMLAAVAHTVPAFGIRIKRQLEEYRTPPSISSYLHRKPLKYEQLDYKYQVAKIQNGDIKTRAMFMREICFKGSSSILEPLLQAGIDVNEVPDVGSRTYLECAARAGNFDVVSRLLKAGARSPYDPLDAKAGPVNPRGGPIKELIRRWEFTKVDYRSEKTKPISEELRVLDELISAPGIPEHATLEYAIYARLPQAVDRLITGGYGRRKDSLLANTDPYLKIGSEVVSAVIHRDFRCLKMLTEHDFGLEYEDLGGYTALLHGLDKGYDNFVALLLQNGAQVAQNTSSGWAPALLAKKNLAAKHPRRPKLMGCCVLNDELESVTYDQDLRTHQLVMDAMGHQPYEKRAGRKTHILQLWASALYTRAQIASLEYGRFRTKLPEVSISEASLVTLGLFITLPAFVFYQVYQLVWWTLKVRKLPRTFFATFLLVFFLLTLIVWILITQSSH